MGLQYIFFKKSNFIWAIEKQLFSGIDTQNNQGFCAAQIKSARV